MPPSMTSASGQTAKADVEKAIPRPAIADTKSPAKARRNPRFTRE